MYNYQKDSDEIVTVTPASGIGKQVKLRTLIPLMQKVPDAFNLALDSFDERSFTTGDQRASGFVSEHNYYYLGMGYGVFRPDLQVGKTLPVSYLQLICIVVALRRVL
ncbi:MAG: hypothetical protein FWF45_04450 [Coriobacteriia bacterium]|nr:hypothetical protein [Coriobacteriia bacterium]